jgi:hypothetical protein
MSTMKRSEIDYLTRRQVVSDSMQECDSIEAEAQLLGLLASGVDDWRSDDFGWLAWVRSRPATRLIIGSAGGGSCFVYSPEERSGYWAVVDRGLRGQGVLSLADVTALEAIASQKGLPAR